MALQTEKKTSLTGYSMIDGKQVVYLNANITTETAGNTNINQSITNQEMYRANLDECRKDIGAFQTAVWAIEDEMIAEAHPAE
ncbi:hypothetical protein [Enterococcus asini]|uniref:hypothetical protein n=1 Tax=Enterococcus asini TaxID=57732 RepID=UPI00241F3EE2|nr:hypothetical protein [Enterococcus asini]